MPSRELRKELHRGSKQHLAESISAQGGNAEGRVVLHIPQEVSDTGGSQYARMVPGMHSLLPSINKEPEREHEIGSEDHIRTDTRHQFEKNEKDIRDQQIGLATLEKDVQSLASMVVAKGYYPYPKKGNNVCQDKVLRDTMQ